MSAGKQSLKQSLTAHFEHLRKSNSMTSAPDELSSPGVTKPEEGPSPSPELDGEVSFTSSSVTASETGVNAERRVAGTDVKAERRRTTEEEVLVFVFFLPSREVVDVL